MAEADSDTETLKILLRRILNNQSMPVRAKAYDGCAALLRKGARDLAAFFGVGVSRFIICHDADRSSRSDITSKVYETVVRHVPIPSTSYCIVVPVQELEAWILSDSNAIQSVLKKVRIRNFPNPESIESPKEKLISLSRDEFGKEQYDPVVHNERVAKFIDLNTLTSKCPSFLPFLEFVRRP